MKNVLSCIALIGVLVLTGCSQAPPLIEQPPIAPVVKDVQKPLTKAIKHADAIRGASENLSYLLKSPPLLWPGSSSQIISASGIIQANAVKLTTDLQSTKASLTVAVKQASSTDSELKALNAKLKATEQQLTHENRMLWGAIDVLGALAIIGGVFVIVALKDGSLGLGLILAGIAGIGVGVGAAFIQSVLWQYMPWVVGGGGALLLTGGVIWGVMWYERGSALAALKSKKSLLKAKSGVLVSQPAAS